jgi:hypothetical protein
LVPSLFFDQSTPPGVLILVYAIAGCMAATVAALTGLGMIRLLPHIGSQDQQHSSVTNTANKAPTSTRL